MCGKYMNLKYRHDVEKNKYYFIDETGKQSLCNQAGRLPHKFVNGKSGFMGFKER